MKHMKKSMFITTVLMVVLLIVAVSTATFAWYTSSNTATATPATLSSATSSSANIAIGWSTTAKTTQVEFKNSGALVPMAPYYGGAAPTKTTYTAAGAVDTQGTLMGAQVFCTGTLQNNNGVMTFKDSNGGANSWVEIENVEEGARDTLYVINYNTSTVATVTITATFADTMVAGENEDMVSQYEDYLELIRIAAFIDSNYIGTLGYVASYTYAKVDGSSNGWESLPQGGETGATATNGCDTTITFKIPVAPDANGTAVKLDLFAWLDGAMLVDALAGFSANFALTFTAA